MSSKGYLVINLHAHLPFINHQGKDYIEENWFFEAVAESYIPFIKMVDGLVKDGIRPSLTLSLSPTLGAMLENDNLEKKLKRYLNSRLDLIEKEYARAGNEGALNALKIYQNLYEDAVETVVKYSGDLITPLKQFQHSNDIEIITTSATHSVLPLLVQKEAVNAQIAMAVEDYKDRFNKAPSGFWLPECAYDERLPECLKLNNLKYFFLESNAVESAARNGVFSAYSTQNDVNFFLRDSVSSMEVWSSQFGYPGNEYYREFYRDIGYDRETEYLKPFTNSELRIPTGLKYHRITGKNCDLADKEYYDREKALEAVDRDASDFLEKRVAQMNELSEKLQAKPLIVNCYDAELFGHWWFEGPAFLDKVIRKIRQDRIPLQIVTPSEYLEISQAPQKMEPNVSSWGENGYFDPWLNQENDFLHDKIYEINQRMVSVANRFKNQDLKNATSRALNQAAREVLLLQSSDWPFMLHTGSHAQYALEAFHGHLKNADKLIKGILEKNLDEAFLSRLEKEHNIFPRMDFRIFCSKSSF